MAGFCVNLDLSRIFFDHRSLAKIYLDEDITTVKKLVKKISTIFKIEKIYLTCDGYFLPPSENIKVLEKQSVVVVRGKKNFNHVQVESKENGLDEDCNENRNKKAKIVPEEDFSVRKETLKASNGAYVCKGVNLTGYIRSVVTKPSTENYLKKKRVNAVPIEKMSPKEKEIHITTNEDTQQLIDEKKSVLNNSILLQHRPENLTKQTTKIINANEEPILENKSIQPPAIGPPNPVEGGSKITPKNSNINLLSVVKIAPKKESSACNVKDTEPNTDSEADVSQITDTDDACKDNDALSVITNATWGSEMSFNMKKKRHRIRKRKSKVKIEVPQEKPVVTYSEPIRTISCPSVHIKFDDEANSTVQENGDEQPQEVVEEMMDTTSICDLISDDFIKSKPLMGSAAPEVNDYIAFKILRLSASYSPEVSNFIAGKVLSVDQGDVTLEVFYNVEQCINPFGKFSLESEEDQNTINYIYTFQWDSLLCTKLLNIKCKN